MWGAIAIQTMTITEITELTLIPVIGGIFWLLGPLLPESIGVGKLLLWSSALLLLQGLIRDLWLLASEKNNRDPTILKGGRYLCVESAIGATGIVVGIAVLGSGIDHLVTMNDWSWSILMMVVVSAGFLIKDFVVELGPLRIRRDKDHLNIVLNWKK